MSLNSVVPKVGAVLDAVENRIEVLSSAGAVVLSGVDTHLLPPKFAAGFVLLQSGVLAVRKYIPQLKAQTAKYQADAEKDVALVYDDVDKYKSDSAKLVATAKDDETKVKADVVSVLHGTLPAPDPADPAAPSALAPVVVQAAAPTDAALIPVPAGPNG